MFPQKSGKKGMALIILDIIREEELHGYGIAERIEEKYGVKRPGSGLIYPILSDLKRKGYVELVEKGKRDKKTYRITEKGKGHLEEKKEELENAKKMLFALGEFSKLGGRELIDAIKLLMENMDALDYERKEKIGKVLRDSARRIKMLVEYGEFDE